MRTSFGLIVAALFLMSSGTRGAPQDVRDDVRGTWDVVDSESSGKKLPQGYGWEFKNGKAIRSYKGKSAEYTYTLNPNKNPKEIDLGFMTGGKVTKVYQGIYEATSDGLKICYTTGLKGDKMRPTTFTSQAGDGHILLVMKRKT
jgi:uncharacterized protein (TIGR03067 family)